MSRFADSAVIELPFRIETISAAAAPDGSSDVWQQYVISQGSNTITGMRPGSRADVEIVADHRRCGFSVLYAA